MFFVDAFSYHQTAEISSWLNSLENEQRIVIDLKMSPFKDDGILIIAKVRDYDWKKKFSVILTDEG